VTLKREIRPWEWAWETLMTSNVMWHTDYTSGFWGEVNPPTHLYHLLVFDIIEDEDTITEEHLKILYLLKKLNIIEYGTIYETIDCIRIKAK